MSLFEEDPVTLYYQSRGLQLENAFNTLIVEYPLGAGLARWGMMRGYFDVPSSSEIWAEIQPGAWILDGGLVLAGALQHRACRDRLVRSKAGAHVVGSRRSLVGIGDRGSQRRDTRARVQLHSLHVTGGPPVLVPRGPLARRDGESAAQIMIPWLLVAGDFTPLGGMDAANHALARYLAARAEVHLVTHRAWPDLAALPTIRVHRAWRPYNRHLLGSPLLSRVGRRVWRRLAPRGVHVVVNGGNCRLGAANWVHYLHAAYAPEVPRSIVRRSKGWLTRQRDLTAEAAALLDARIVICNSQRTRDDVIGRVGVAPSRVHVVYYGTDPHRFSYVDAAACSAAKAALMAAPDRPLLGFVGALGDRRKAFDTLFDAWTALCRRREWDADLIVVGSGAELPAWRRRAEAAGLRGRMRFAGFRRDVPQVLAALDALVHPARYEAYGLSVHEALARGIPALVSASAGVAEHYPCDLKDLLMADPDDPAELVDRLLWWRRELERMRAAVVPLSDALRSRTWDAMAAEIAQLVEQAA